MEKAPRTRGKNDLLFPYLLVIGAVVIWGAWMPATRLAANQGIAPVDVALLRYGIPAILLAPVLLASMRQLRAMPLWTLVAMMGWGAPFVILMSLAMERASVAHVAAIVPCLMPLVAVLLERMFFRTPVARAQAVGFGFIAAAAALVLWRVISGQTGTDLVSVAYLFCAALGWAGFTVGFRRSGLTAAQATGIVCLVSTAIVLAMNGFSLRSLSDVPAPQLLFHGMAQGVFSGFVATICYAVAINRLGSARAASFTVLVPVLATLLAFVWLGERPGMIDIVALVAGSLGVAIVNGVIRIAR